MEYEYDYLITKPELSEDTLEHFGVKGMHWGVRKQPERTGNGRRKKSYHGRVQSPAEIARAAKKVSTIKKQRKAAMKTDGGRSAMSADKKATAKKVLKAAGIAAGVTLAGLAAYTFLSPKYGKGNRMYVAGKTKEFLYKQGRKFADGVVRRRNARTMKRTVKSLPRIGAKKIVDTTFKDVTNTGLTQYTALARRSNRPSGKDIAKVGAGLALVGAGAYADHKTRQAIKNHRSNKRSLSEKYPLPANYKEYAEDMGISEAQAKKEWDEIQRRNNRKGK